MKKKIIYSFFILIAIIAQASVLPVILGRNFYGDVVLAAVLAWSVLDGFRAFLGWAVLCGILYDLAAYSPVGEHALIFLFVVYFVSFFSKRLSVELEGIKWILFFVFVVAATFISEGVIALMQWTDAQTLSGYWKASGGFGSLFLRIVCNGFLFFFWFGLLKKIKKFFQLETR